MGIGKLKRLVLGEPLLIHQMHEEKIPKWKALAVLSSDALSSVAYATEEILIPLALFATAAVAWSIPIALAISALLFILTLSYRQTIDAYPGGGGAYIVAKENLGQSAGLIAGASLLIDYILTVSVSVAAGVDNIASAFPWLQAHKVFIGVTVIILIMLLNLRGVKDSATIFALPTYLFIVSIVIMIVVGGFQLLTGQHPQVAPVVHEAYPAIPLFLLLRAFSSGCSALTGIEAISNGIPLFQNPAQKNARITMTWMAGLLGGMFLGLTLLAHAFGVFPVEGQTTISTLAKHVFGGSFFYFVIQASTALILFLAANTSYADFPRLSSIMAKDRFLPRQLAMLGDRLVFSNGIIGLSFFACLLLVLFGGDTHHLIPLYAIGVFLSFTLSQTGMIVHHLRLREKNWTRSLVFNALGALTTFVVLLVIASTKFVHGAWMVIVLIPAVTFVFLRIHKHYVDVGRELSLYNDTPKGPIIPLKHVVIIPISGIHRGVLDALTYAVSISNDVRAVYVELDTDATTRFQAEWDRWAKNVPFIVLKSPYRSVISPLLDYIDEVDRNAEKEFITVLIPEFVTAKWWHQVLHNQTAFLIRTALLFRRRKVVTSVRYHLKST